MPRLTDLAEFKPEFDRKTRLPKAGAWSNRIHIDGGDGDWHRPRTGAANRNYPNIPAERRL